MDYMGSDEVNTEGVLSGLRAARHKQQGALLAGLTTSEKSSQEGLRQKPSFVQTILEPKSLLGELITNDKKPSTQLSMLKDQKIESKWQQLRAKQFDPDRRGFKHTPKMVAKKKTHKGKSTFEVQNLSRDEDVTTPVANVKKLLPLESQKKSLRQSVDMPPSTRKKKEMMQRYPRINFTQTQTRESRNDPNNLKEIFKNS